MLKWTPIFFALLTTIGGYSRNAYADNVAAIQRRILRGVLHPLPDNRDGRQNSGLYVISYFIEGLGPFVLVENGIPRTHSEYSSWRPNPAGPITGLSPVDEIILARGYCVYLIDRGVRPLPNRPDLSARFVRVTDLIQPERCP